jgi:hypothetical protein
MSLGGIIGLFGAYQSADAQKQAASSNAYLAKMNAQANAQASVYANELNYQSAMMLSQEQANNSTVLMHYAGTQEQQGNEQISRMVMNEQVQQSKIRAAYGASGVTGDSGSALQVSAYQAGVSQLNRMDTQYKVNTDATNTQYQAGLQAYQSQLTAENAKQYKYAEQMANWSAQAQIAGADVQQRYQNAAANAQITQAWGSMVSQMESDAARAASGGAGG